MIKSLKFLSVSLVCTTVAITVLSLTSCNLLPKPENDETNFVAEDTPMAANEDSKILSELIALNQKEVVMSKLALEKSTNDDVTALATTLEMAHSTVLAELGKLAEDHALAIPTELSDKAHDAKHELDNLTGKAFDLAYCDMMVESHLRCIAMMESAAANAQDANFRGWASRTLPQLRLHQEEALSCQKKCQAA